MTKTQEIVPEILIAYTIPVIGGLIHLGQRATEPKKGLYGAVGGHSEPRAEGQGEPHRIEKPGGSMQPSVIERMAAAQGREYMLSTAVRECLEELFDGEKPDMDSISDLVPIRGIGDDFRGNHYFNYFFLGTINRPASDLNPVPRELTDVRPLVDIPTDQIYPIAQVALEETRRILTYFMACHDPCLKPYLEMNLAAQIPKFDLDEMSRFLSEREVTMQHMLTFQQAGRFVWIPGKPEYDCFPRLAKPHANL
ncbi:MAG: hypothetical protein ABIE94_02565 [archaeon]